jgi:hypothetical protein
VFPRQRPGLDYDLNWSLADDDVTPKGDAYRNAPLRVLQQYSAAGKRTSTGGVTASQGTVQSFTTGANADTTTLDEFDEKYRLVSK